MDKINYKLINFTIIMIIFFFIFLTSSVWINIIKIIKEIIMPFLISFSIAYVINPIVKMIKKKVKSNNLSVIIVIVLLILILFGLFYFSIPILTRQIISLSNNVLPFINELFNKPFFNNFIGIEDFLINNINDIIEKVSNNYISIFSKSIHFFKDCLIIVILTIYFLFKIDNIKVKIVKLFKNKQKLINVLKKIDNSLNNYLRALIIIIIIETIEYSLIYLIVGHPNFLLLGILAGITTIIPYFGSLFTNLLALITAINISPILFIVCAFIALIIPIIDNYIVDPKIYHKTNQISPIKVILSMTISSVLFGFIGLIIAIPLLIIVEEIFYLYNEEKTNIVIN